MDIVSIILDLNKGVSYFDIIDYYKISPEELCCIDIGRRMKKSIREISNVLSMVIPGITNPVQIEKLYN